MPGGGASPCGRSETHTHSPPRADLDQPAGGTSIRIIVHRPEAVPRTNAQAERVPESARDSGKAMALRIDSENRPARRWFRLDCCHPTGQRPRTAEVFTDGKIDAPVLADRQAMQAIMRIIRLGLQMRERGFLPRHGAVNRLDSVERSRCARRPPANRRARPRGSSGNWCLHKKW